MKVMLIDVNCKQGSTGKIVYDLYTELNKDGHTTSICYGRGKKIHENNIYKFSTDVEMYIHAVMTRITGLTGYFSPLATMNLLSIIRHFKPDVVHIHDPKTYYLNIGLLMRYLKINNIKTIFTLHSEFMYTGKCGHAFECEKWKAECSKCPQIKEYPKSIYFDFTKKMYNDKKKWFEGFNNITIVTPSNWLEERVKKSFLSNKKICTVYNGINTKDVFYPHKVEHLKKRHNLNNEKIILTVAPNLMSDLKGGRWVLKLAKMFKGENVKFFLIGVEDLTEKFDDNIVALGRIENQHQLAEYYSMADLFVLCSKRETYSLTCAESLSCGTPVVGFKSGAPETISIKEYSEFVDYGDIEKLSETISKWINKKKDISSNLSKIACENYSNDNMYKGYLNLYEN